MQLRHRRPQAEASQAPAATGACCACGSPSPNGKLTIGGESVTINGLPLIFDHLKKKGLKPGSGCADTLLETVEDLPTPLKQTRKGDTEMH